MRSWWVGISREDFYREILTRKFLHFRIWAPDPMKEERSDTLRARLASARAVLKHRRSMGFDIANQRNVFITEDKSEKRELEVIPYCEWAETPIDIRIDAEDARDPRNPEVFGKRKQDE